MPPGAPPDFTIQFRRRGQLYGGPYAITQARAARDEAATLSTLMSIRRMLPPVVSWAAGLAGVLSAAVLVAGGLLGRFGRASRETLVRGFAAMRRVLPPVLALRITLGTVAFVAAVAFEAAALAQPGLGSAEMKMIAVAIAAVLASLWVAGKTLLRLRHALAAFEPDPLPMLGRPVGPAEAPGLWRLVTELATKLDALAPESIVVGLTEGFSVSAGPKILEPAEQALDGRTLYVPLPYLALLRPDEIATIISHELAHFAGGDTSYSLRFLPIYAGVDRSLSAVADGAASGSAFGLLRPAMRLGSFVMDQFHYAVRHWSREREFAADALSVRPTSPDAAMRALLRTGAVTPRVNETLDHAIEFPHAAPADLVTASIETALARGLDDPGEHLGIEQAHPTDTHPTTRDRLARFGGSLTPTLLAAAAAPPEPDAHQTLARYFADPARVCENATADFVGVVREHHHVYQAHLEATAAEVGEEARVLFDNSRRPAIFCSAVGAVFLLASLALAILGFPGLSRPEAHVVAWFACAPGAVFAAVGIVRLRRGERVLLTLRPDALVIPALDRPLPWHDIADLDMHMRYNGIGIRLLLPPEAPFPQCTQRSRALKLDTERRIITLRIGVPRKMAPRQVAELLGLYRRAAQARTLLTEHHARPTEPTDFPLPPETRHDATV